MKVPRAVSTTTSWEFARKRGSNEAAVSKGLWEIIIEEQELVSVQVVDPWLIE